MSRKTILAAVLAAGLIAAGCGDDDDAADPGESESASPTKEEWIAEADQICAEGDEEIEAEATKVFSGGAPSQQKIEQFTRETLIPGIRSQAEQIEALGAPEGDEEEVEAIVTSLNEGLGELEEDPSSLEGPDGALAEATRRVSEYGAQVCGS